MSAQSVRCLLLALAATAASGLPAQEVPEGPVFTEIVPAWATQNRVTILKSQLPLKDCAGAVFVVDPPILDERARETGPDEALRLVPGVTCDSPDDQARVRLSVRGAGLDPLGGTRGVMVLLDGIPLTDPAGTTSDMLDADWSSVQSVEVLRGPASALYGAGGASGALHIITREGPNPNPSGRSDFALGSDGFWKVYAEAGGGDRRGFSYRASASKSIGDGYRDHASSWSTNLFTRARWNLDPFGSYAMAVVSGTDCRSQDPGGLDGTWLSIGRREASPDALAYDGYTKTRKLLVGTSGKLVYSEAHDFSYSAYTRSQKTWESLPGAVGETRSTSPGTSFQYAWHAGRAGRFRRHLFIGADSSWQSADYRFSPNLGGAEAGAPPLADGKVHQSGYGIFAQERMEFGTQWTATVSLRRDKVKQELWDHLAAGGKNLSGKAYYRMTTARLGLTFAPTDLFNLYASWGQGFVPPSGRDLAADSRMRGRAVGYLPATTSRGADLGVRGAAGQFLYYDAALYLAEARNELLPAATPTAVPRAFDLADTTTYGLEAYLMWFPVQGLSLRATYTYSHFNLDRSLVPLADPTLPPLDCSGNRPPGTPEHRGYLDIGYAWQSGWRVGLGVEVRSRSYADATNSAWAGGATLLNPRAAYLWRGARHRGEFYFQLRNATGREYSAWVSPGAGGARWYPAPERQFFMGLRIAWDRG